LGHLLSNLISKPLFDSKAQPHFFTLPNNRIPTKATPFPCTIDATTLNQAQRKFATNSTKAKLKDIKAMPIKQDCVKLKLRDNG
jgi:hypothetical protein